MRGPELQLGIARRAKFDEKFLAAVLQLHGADGLRMAPVQGFGQPQDRGQVPDRVAQLGPQRREFLVRFFRRRLAVVTGDQRNHGDLFRLEPAQIPILHQVVRMLVMSRIADVGADVVQ